MKSLSSSTGSPPGRLRRRGLFFEETNRGTLVTFFATFAPKTSSRLLKSTVTRPRLVMSHLGSRSPLRRKHALANLRFGNGCHGGIAVDKNCTVLFNAGGDECVHRRQARASDASQVRGGIGGFSRERQNPRERFGEEDMGDHRLCWRSECSWARSRTSSLMGSVPGFK